MKSNYDLILKETISENGKAGIRPKLLLHACCAPCSSYVLEYIAGHFDVTLYFYNPNITPEKEYLLRLSELKRFVSEAGYSIDVDHPDYDSGEFFDAVRGLEKIPEGGERCYKCYSLRLRKTAEAALVGGFDYFTTTLSISPYKNSEWINTIGAELEKELGVRYLFSDFKKNNGYRRSIELSKEYGLYRQDYCGCVFSKTEAEERRRQRSEGEK